MTEDVKAFYDQYKKSMGKVQGEAPDVLSGFGSMFSAIMKDGALPVKTKELICVAISCALRCEPCIHLHVKKCLGCGASRAEILEAAGVAVVMQGGPSFTYLPKVMAALDANEA